jgi:hypothetical protein
MRENELRRNDACINNLQKRGPMNPGFKSLQRYFFISLCAAPNNESLKSARSKMVNL